jgi:carboxypeptidase T
MKKLLLLIIPIIFTSTLYSQQIIIRLDNPVPAVINHFYDNDYDIASYRPGEYLDLVVSEEDLARLRSQGYDFTIYVTEAEMAANLYADREIPGYRTYAEAVAELQQIEIDHPGICKLYNLGNSRGKDYFNAGNNNYINYQHDIWALKLSSNVNVDEDKPAVFYMGAHHAREPLSTEVTFYVLNHLLQNYGIDPEITNSISTKEIWFIPIVNPDGHKIVLDQVDVWWRKNIRDNNNNGQLTLASGGSYPDGVDPNRNYGWEWGGQGSSGSTTSQLYRGPSAFSEPETDAMKDLMASRHFVAGITYHTYSELVLWPYGYVNNAVAPDAIALAELGTAMAVTIARLGSGYYTPQPSWALYPAAGVTDDYAYGQHGIFCYTIELATQFIPPASQVVQVCEDNLEAALILLNRIDNSTLTGIVTDAVTGDPLVAKVFVEGIDNTGLYREPYRSNEAFGRYFRMLPDGDYTVTFSAVDYFDQTFSNVNIHDLGQTVLNVAMVHEDDNTVNGVVNNGQELCFDAIQTISVSDFVVEDGGTAYLIAGVKAILNPGTFAVEGSYFSVRISDIFCSQPESMLASEIAILPEQSANNADEMFFRIFPNPTSGRLTLEYIGNSDPSQKQLEIFNMMGEMLFQLNLTGKRMHEIDMSAFPNGIYLFKVMKDASLGFEKVIKY